MIYLVMGQIGAGKSVMSKKLCEHLKAKHLALGQLLRDTYPGHPKLKHGELMPDELVYKAIRDFIDASGSETIVVDGFPRNKQQQEWLHEYLLENPEQYLKAVFILNVSEGEVKRRLKQRGREDDTDDAIKQRKQIFAQHVQPLIDYYSKHEQAIHIDADGGIDKVFAEMRAKLPQ